MGFDTFEMQLQAILAVPPALAQYECWVQQSPRPSTNRDYLFSEPRPRFEPRKHDVLVCMPGLEVVDGKAGALVRCAQPAVQLEVDGVVASDVRRLLRCMDGSRCLLEALWDSDTKPEALAAVLRSTFGRVVFAPSAVEALENRLSGTEIVRFPCPPYAIERAYWENMADVRERLLQSESALGLGIQRFVELLRELHVVTVMGRNLDSFYRPASPGADRMVGPGQLLLEAPRCKKRSSARDSAGQGTHNGPYHAAHTKSGSGASRYVFLDGPRVNVSLVGGDAWHVAVSSSLGDAEALGAERTFEEDQLSFGRFVLARADKDDRDAPWFLPPRPILDAHFDWLLTHYLTAWRAADSERETAIAHLARFHQGFVRLHPFHCANQSLAMNMVNAVLARAVGGGIPHLLLDVFALRLSADAYEKLFRRAVRSYVIVDRSAAHRLETLLRRHARASALIQKLHEASGPADVTARIDADREGASWALVRD